MNANDNDAPARRGSSTQAVDCKWLSVPPLHTGGNHVDERRDDDETLHGYLDLPNLTFHTVAARRMSTPVEETDTNLQREKFTYYREMEEMKGNDASPAIHPLSRLR